MLLIPKKNTNTLKKNIPKLFFFELGALLLIAASLSSLKKKSIFGNIAPALYVSSQSGCVVLSDNPVFQFTTTATSVGQAAIADATGQPLKLYWTSNCNSIATYPAYVRFHP